MSATIADPVVAGVTHLLVVQLGPVQDFIAQARRTRDLWFGSHLLSELKTCRTKPTPSACRHVFFRSVVAVTGDNLS